MSTTSLPPLHPSDDYNANTCATMRLYLAVWNDLTPAQRNAALSHIEVCQRCQREQRLMNGVTLLLTTLEESQPSQRVDAAVMAAIAARSQTHYQGVGNSDGIFRSGSTRSTNSKQRMSFAPQVSWSTSLRYVGIFIAAAVVLLAVFTTTRFVKQSSSSVFLLPATLSWSTYILYHTQKEHDPQGQEYQIESYHDLDSQQVHVETTQGSTLDVVYIGSMDNASPSLAMDEIHHVAQWNTKTWSLDATTESMFNLSTLRHELQDQSAVYADKDSFHGQTVYRIRCKNGLMLLLDTHYQPVNVLVGAVGVGTGEPVFDKLKLLPRGNFDNSMWNMQVPNGFTMGALPAKP